MIDSTEADVIEAALEHIPGRAIINSINMENGRKRIDSVVPLAKKHGAALVALTIDPVGMAKTRERKLEVAQQDLRHRRRRVRPARRGPDLRRADLHARHRRRGVDRLSAHETIEGIRLIKRELPGVFTILGVSNVSFGLDPAARDVLNSVFLHHCVEAGLDAAIVNPAHITPYAEISAEQRALADDLVFNRRPDALQRFIEHFDGDVGRRGRGRPKADPTAGMTPEAEGPLDDAAPEEGGDRGRARRRRRARESGARAQRGAAAGDEGGRRQVRRRRADSAVRAAERRGDEEGGEAPRDSSSRRRKATPRARSCSPRCTATCTTSASRSSTRSSPTTATPCYDLGKQVPVNTIIEKAVEVDADAIGLSALLVTTSKQMPLCVQELDKRGIQIPVLIGGAAINRRFGRRAMFVEGERAVRAGRLLLQGRVRGAGDDGHAPGPAERRAGVDRASCSTTRARTCSCATNVGKDLTRGERHGRAQRRVAGPSGPDAAVLGNAGAARHPDRRGVRPARPRRAVSPAVGRARLRAGVPADGEGGVRAHARAAAQGGDRARAGSSRRRCTATSRCRAWTTTSSSTIPRRTRATARWWRRSRASTSRGRMAASDCASPTTSAPQRAATSTSWRFRS